MLKKQIGIKLPLISKFKASIGPKEEILSIPGTRASAINRLKKQSTAPTIFFYELAKNGIATYEYPDKTVLTLEYLSTGQLDLKTLITDNSITTPEAANAEQESK